MKTLWYSACILLAAASFLATPAYAFSSDPAEKAVGFVVGITVFAVIFAVLRYLWRGARRAAKALPANLEDAARVAGVTAAKAERTAKRAAEAFKQGRRDAL